MARNTNYDLLNTIFIKTPSNPIETSSKPYETTLKFHENLIYKGGGWFLLLLFVCFEVVDRLVHPLDVQVSQEQQAQVGEPFGGPGSCPMKRKSASGSEIGPPGRILTGLLPGKYRNRPPGRPSAGRRADFDAFPVAVRPKSGREGPEAILRNIE